MGSAASDVSTEAGPVRTSTALAGILLKRLSKDSILIFLASRQRALNAGLSYAGPVLIGRNRGRDPALFIRRGKADFRLLERALGNVSEPNTTVGLVNELV